MRARQLETTVDIISGAGEFRRFEIFRRISPSDDSGFEGVLYIKRILPAVPPTDSLMKPSACVEMGEPELAEWLLLTHLRFSGCDTVEKVIQKLLLEYDDKIANTPGKISPQ